MKQETEKKVYVAPELTAYGDVEEVTQGQSSGDFLDDDFPRGTPFSNLTFS